VHRADSKFFKPGKSQALEVGRIGFGTFTCYLKQWDISAISGIWGQIISTLLNYGEN
jgi:hypothetical protein